ncbi:MAG: hypothetical protein HY835_00440 [Anaerolineae bacterium]|nr:hypothetical protein [Anaerolineae bacterium]
MFSALLGIPMMLLVVMLQTVVVRSLPLLQGSADLVMVVIIAWSLQERVEVNYTWAIIGGLLVGLVSSVPWYVPVTAYLLVNGIANFLRRQAWQTPILAMILTTLVGSIISLGLQWAVLQVQGIPLPWLESFNLVLLPTTFLNLLLSLPVYALITDMAGSVYPEEVVV